MSRRSRPRTRKELRCECSRRPLLAFYGITEDGQIYAHQKVYKQGRVYGESVFVGGVVEIKCRECYRWTTVRMIGSRETVRRTSGEESKELIGGGEG